MKTCEDCIHIEVCALCAPPLPICDLFMSKDDIASVVRCKDCKFNNGLLELGDLQCYILDVPMKNDDFCSYGERRSDETD